MTSSLGSVPAARLSQSSAASTSPHPVVPPMKPVGQSDHLFEGLLCKYTNVMKGWQYRWCVLNDTSPNSPCLEYYEKQEHKQQKTRGVILLSGSTIQPVEDDEQNAFSIYTSNGQTFRLKAADSAERQAWLDRLKAATPNKCSVILPPKVPTPNPQRKSTVSNTPASLDLSGSTSSLRALKKNQSFANSPFFPNLTVSSLEKVQQKNQTCFENLEKHIDRALKYTESTASLDDPNRPVSDLLPVEFRHQLLLIKATSLAATSAINKSYSILKYGAVPHSAIVTKRPDSGKSAKSENSMDAEASLPLITTTPRSQSSSSTIDHDKAVEDTKIIDDKELGSMESHKNIVVQLASQARLAVDLTKVSLPIFILEKRSLLELFADCMAHPQLFLSIADAPTPQLRMYAVLKWYLTSFHASRKENVAKKPYNPILGEEFHCCWNVPSDNKTPQVSPSSPSSDQNQKSPSSSPHTRITFCSEQVSHHPPISAFHIECAEKGLTLSGSIWMKSKFLGLSIGCDLVGDCTVKVSLPDRSVSESYVFTLPSVYAKGILSTPYIELGDFVKISCPESGLNSEVVFHTKSFYDGDDSHRHRVTAQMFDNSDKLVLNAHGYWNRSFAFEWCGTGKSETVEVNSLKVYKKYVRPEALQGRMESRSLWSKVTKALAAGDLQSAQVHKNHLETAQRNDEKRRVEAGDQGIYPGKFFHRVPADSTGLQWIHNSVSN